MAEYAYHIKIPKERIAVLIGVRGQIKRQIEETTKTAITVDSKEGDVSVTGEDALSLYSTRDIIRAVGRGFNPEIAMLLLKQDYVFEVLSLPDFENQTQFRRIKGRIIGKDGKSRRIIEEYTNTYISVYGKTVGIIGQADDASNSRRAIEMLIKGSPHSNVYRWLEKRARELKRREHEENIEDYFKEDIKKPDES